MLPNVNNTKFRVTKTRFRFFKISFGDSSWRQPEAGNLLLAGAVEANAHVHWALRRLGLSGRGSKTQPFHYWEAVTLTLSYRQWRIYATWRPWQSSNVRPF